MKQKLIYILLTLLAVAVLPSCKPTQLEPLVMPDIPTSQLKSPILISQGYLTKTYDSYEEKCGELGHS